MTERNTSVLPTAINAVCSVTRLSNDEMVNSPSTIAVVMSVDVTSGRRRHGNSTVSSVRCHDAPSDCAACASVCACMPSSPAVNVV